VQVFAGSQTSATATICITKDGQVRQRKRRIKNGDLKKIETIMGSTMDKSITQRKCRVFDTIQMY
jgi:hypothetical protein